jgi:hypothetical protein
MSKHRPTPPRPRPNPPAEVSVGWIQPPVPPPAITEKASMRRKSPLPIPPPGTADARHTIPVEEDWLEEDAKDRPTIEKFVVATPGAAFRPPPLPAMPNDGKNATNAPAGTRHAPKR